MMLSDTERLIVMGLLMAGLLLLAFVVPNNKDYDDEE
jgi:hypothetical protein